MPIPNISPISTIQVLESVILKTVSTGPVIHRIFRMTGTMTVPGIFQIPGIHPVQTGPVTGKFRRMYVKNHLSVLCDKKYLGTDIKWITESVFKTATS